MARNFFVTQTRADEEDGERAEKCDKMLLNWFLSCWNRDGIIIEIDEKDGPSRNVNEQIVPGTHLCSSINNI